MNSLIQSKRVVMEPTPVVIGQGVTGHKQDVKVLLTDDQVSSIEIRCSCGEVILLDCVYGTQPGA